MGTSTRVEEDIEASGTVQQVWSTVLEA
uniref:Uncharacterized protein n=1 Tax=Oryza rufipogon TaxID=4529 RepID=A0A0E0QHV4_ORYRU